MRNLLFTAFLVCLCGLSTNAQDNYICFTILETEPGSTLDVDQIVWKANRDIWIDSTQVIKEAYFSKHFNGRQLTEAYLLCAYSMDELSLDKWIEVHEFTTTNGEKVYLVVDDYKGVAYFIYMEELYLLSPCTEDSYCYNDFYYPVRLQAYSETIKLFPDDVDLVVDTAVFELVTEQVLIQEAYNIPEVIPAEFQMDTMVYEKGVEIICDPKAEYEYISDSILIKPEYTQLMVFPAVFETVTEQVLDKQAYTYVDSMNRQIMDSVFTFVVKPAYKDYFWHMLPNSIGDHPFDCLRLDSMHQEEVELSFDIQYPEACPEEYESIGSACFRNMDVPATYSSRIYEKLITPAYAEAESVPAEYFYFQRQHFSDLENIPDSCIGIIYDTILIESLVSPASTVNQTIPATYDTRMYEVLLRNGQVQSDVLQSFEVELNGYHLIRDGFNMKKFSVCDLFWEDELLEAIKERLISQGYLINEQIEIRTELFWDAIFRYQIDRNLPFGSISEEFLAHLGI